MSHPDQVLSDMKEDLFTMSKTTRLLTA